MVKSIFIEFKSPAGFLRAACDASGSILSLDFLKNKKNSPASKIKPHSTLLDLQKEILEYFSGKKLCFSAHLHPRGTDFQKKVWRELLKISHGSTVSYKKISERIGRSRSVRAVANAVGANPIAIVIPCHRVIGSDGSLRGYAHGISVKKKLLQIEKKTVKK